MERSTKVLIVYVVSSPSFGKRFGCVLYHFVKLQSGVDEAHTSKRDRPLGYTTFESWMSNK
jgi:hypothetical protein